MKRLAAMAAISALLTCPALATQDFICKFASGDAQSEFAAVTTITISGDDDWIYMGGTKADGTFFGFGLPQKRQAH